MLFPFHFQMKGAGLQLRNEPQMNWRELINLTISSAYKYTCVCVCLSTPVYGSILCMNKIQPEREVQDLQVASNAGWRWATQPLIVHQ